MTVQLVTSKRPAFISGIFTRPYTVRNAGTVEIYLGQDTSLTADTRSITLPVGAALQWNGATELYAITASADGYIEYIYEGVAAFSASGVQVTDPITIDNVTTVLYNDVPNLPVGTNLVYYAANLDSYASLIINQNTPTNLAAAASSVVNTLIVQWETAAGVVVDTDRPRFSATGHMTFQIPIKAEAVRILALVVAGGAVAGIPYSVVATSAALPRYYFHEYGLTSQVLNYASSAITSQVQGGYWAFRGTRNAVATGTVFMNHSSGQVYITITNPNATVIEHRYNVWDSVLTVSVAKLTVAAGSTGEPKVTVFPESPMYLAVSAANQIIDAAISYILAA